MNGSFYEECFYDFYNLVKEINEGSPSQKGTPRIQLRYFPKTKENIDRFFKVAARIKNGEENLYRDDKEAMKSILNNSVDEIGVLKYKPASGSHGSFHLRLKSYKKDIVLLKYLLYNNAKPSGWLDEWLYKRVIRKKNWK